MEENDNDKNDNSNKSIYQNYRKKIFDPLGKERQMLDEVEKGKESAYKFDATDGGIEGLYIKRTSKAVKYLYASIGLIIFSFFVYVGVKKVNPNAEDHFNKYKSVIADVENMETDINDKRKELVGIINTLKKSGKAKDFDLSKSDDYMLSAEEEKYLSEQVAKEKGSEVKNIIKTLVAKNDEIKSLKEELEERKKTLRAPVVMTKNLGHDKIAMDFLVNEIGLPADQAREKIENVNMFDYSYDGLYVWNYYENGFYGTFVTKGKANKSPNQIKKLARLAYENKIATLKKSEKFLKEEQTNLKEEKDNLEYNLATSKQEAEKLAQEKQKVAADKEEISSKASGLESEVKKRDALIRQMNTLYYSLSNLKEGQKQNIIDKGFFSGPEIINDEKIKYDLSLDLTEERKIILSPEQFKLKEFKNVYILPEDHLKRGSIKKKMEKTKCEIIISRPEYLKEQRILIIAE